MQVGLPMCWQEVAGMSMSGFCLELPTWKYSRLWAVNKISGLVTSILVPRRWLVKLKRSRNRDTSVLGHTG